MTGSGSTAGPRGLEEPLAVEVEGMLRRIVLEHVVAERRRRHMPLLHVGRPGADVIHPVRPDEPTDHALRVDVVAAMVRRSRNAPTPPLVWLTRGGPHEIQDVDVEWLAGAWQAFAEAGLPLMFVVVGRHGWFDPRSGVRRSWVRLRRRTTPGAAGRPADRPPS